MSKDQNLIKVFEYALNQEKTGKSFFETSLQRMGVGAAVTAFTRIIQEEDRHIFFINSILEDLNKKNEINLSDLGDLVMDSPNYFDERAKSEFLEQCVYESMIPDVTVFNTAWLIEKDLSEFYENMAKHAKGMPKKALNMLASWEKSHERFFREYRDKLTEIYSKMPWGG